MHYTVDEHILEDLKEILLSGSQDEWNEFKIIVQQRLDGVCFCAARCTEECTCGAWDVQGEDN